MKSGKIHGLSKRAERIGAVFDTNRSGKAVVMDYVNNDNVLIEFLETGNTKIVGWGELVRGGVKDKGTDVLMFGTRDYSRLKSIYTGICNRVENASDTHCPTYIGCSIGGCFSSVRGFIEWAITTPYYNMRDDEGFHYVIEKDVLIPGNTVYSEDCCTFVPRELNTFFRRTKSSQSTSKYVGVYCGAKYSCDEHIAEVSNKRFGVSLSNSFKTELEAANWYKEEKSKIGHTLAAYWQGRVDERVIEKLREIPEIFFLRR